MMIKKNRVERLLAESRFSFVWGSTNDLNFVRESSTAEIFEHVHIGASGKKGEAVYAYAQISLLKGPLRTKTLSETRPILEVATDKERAWTIVETADDAACWESCLAKNADPECRKLTSEKALGLIERTVDIQTATRRYLDLLPSQKSLQSLLASLECQARPEAHSLAEKMYNWPGLMWVPGERGELLYRIATIAIASLADEVESRPNAFGIEPCVEDRAMMGRIQLLVDLLDRRSLGQTMQA